VESVSGITDRKKVFLIADRVNGLARNHVGPDDLTAVLKARPKQPSWRQSPNATDSLDTSFTMAFVTRRAT
jgi:hypothetical protein